MRKFAPIGIALVAGFAAGWLSAGIPVKRSGNPRSATASSKDPTGGWTPPSELVARLSSPADCRTVIEGGTPDGLHPLVAQTTRDRAWRRWLELDPPGALAYAEGNADTDWWSPDSPATDLFRVWVDMDAEAALAAFTTASTGLQKAMRASFFTHLAQIDPAQAFEEFMRPRWQESQTRYEETGQEILSIWAASDPHAAAEALERWRSLADDDYRSISAIPVFARAWATADPVAAWEHFRKSQEDDPVPFVGETIGFAASYLLEFDPDAALEELTPKVEPGALPPEDPRFWCADEWVRRDPEGAIAHARARPPGDPMTTELLVNAGWEFATADPELALDLLAEAGGSPDQWHNHGFVREAFHSLMAQDPDAAMARLATLPERGRRNALSGILAQQFAESAEQGIASARTMLDEATDPATVLRALARALDSDHDGGDQPLGQVLFWIPEMSEHIRDGMLEGWVRTAPEEAAAYMTERYGVHPSPWIGNGRDAVEELAASRPEFTAAWVEALPEGEFRQNSANVLRATWRRFNPESADAWVESLEDPELKAALAIPSPAS